MGMECRQSNVGHRLVNESLDRYLPSEFSWFQPSSTMKIIIYRGFGTNINLFNGFVVQYEGKVVDLLENGQHNARYMHAFGLTTI